MTGPLVKCKFGARDLALRLTHMEGFYIEACYYKLNAYKLVIIMTRIRPELCGSGCDGIRISLERRVRLDPSILTATTTDPTPDPKDL